MDFFVPAFFCEIAKMLLASWSIAVCCPFLLLYLQRLYTKGRTLLYTCVFPLYNADMCVFPIGVKMFISSVLPWRF